MKKILAAMFLAASAALALALCAAATCITDVMVVGGADKSVTNSYAELGWKVIAQDLNAKAGGDYVFLLYKSADSASVSNGFITGFYIKTGAVTNELTHAGRVYRLAPCDGDAGFVDGKGDLNSKTTKQGDVIYLYYTKSAMSGNRVVAGITFNGTQSGAVGKNGGTTGYDLNSHAEGDFIYMHVTTAALPYAPGVSYLDPTDPENPGKVRYGCTLMSGQTTLSSGWYVVAGAVTNDSRITVSGDVNLILTDGAELAANGGVTMDRNNVTNCLTIWAQSMNAVAGKLTARGDGSYAGIGASNSGGTVTINGGKVAAYGGDYAAGIGGGNHAVGCTVTVNGGTVDSYGGWGAAGIGGGFRGAGGTVTVNGGTVEAHGGVNGAGIGGGDGGAGGTVTVNGGTVTAKGGSDAAAIGAGRDVTNDGSLSIDDGMRVGYVEADGKVHEWAACGDRDGYCRNRNGKTVRIEVCSTHVFEGATCKICGDKARYLDPTDPANPEKVCQDFTVISNQTALSSGWYVVAGTVTNDSRIYVSGDVNLILCDRAELAANGGITVDMNDSITNRLTIWAQSTNAVAGKLTARGGEYQAGIGGVKYSPGGVVTINGGRVEAYGGGCGAGIGGGYWGAGGEVTVNGGMLEAYGGDFGAGIGGGSGRAGGTVTVNDGTVKAVGGNGGAGIGGGESGWWGGEVTINGGTVTAKGGSDAAAIGTGRYVDNHGSLSIDGMKVGYVDDDGKVYEWAAPGDREDYCRNRDEKTVRIEVCDPHEYVGVNCRWCGAPVAVEFGKTEYEVGEGAALTVEVKGGNAKMPSRAAVYLSYLTAAAADLDLKNGTVDGEMPKGGLKFPLTLTWDAGDKAPKTITIPVKEDKTVEGYETFCLQLAEPVGMELGEKEIAQVTIADKNDKQLKPTVSPYKPKKGETVATNIVEVSASPSDLGFAAGSGSYTAGTKLTMVAEARPGCTFVGWEKGGEIVSDKAKYQIVVSNDCSYTARFAGTDYITALARPADGGKATGSGYCPAGKKVTLKATASKGFAFLGWRRVDDGGRGATALPDDDDGRAGSPLPAADDDFVATTASLVIDRTAKPAKDSKTSTTLTNITSSATFYAVFEPDPLVSAIPVEAEGETPKGVNYDAGKVTGMGRYAPGKKVTLKATASKGFAFSGFFDAEGNLLDETRSASYSFEMPSNDVPLTARFVTVDEDQASIKLSVAGEELSREPAFTPAKTNFCGVAMNWSLAADALSATTIKVAGLPSGLKFTAKDILKKGSKTEVEIPANTIYGAPTAASKTDKNGNVTPSKVVFTVKTAGKSTQTFTINLYIDPLPAWAVGTFDGATYVGDSAEASGLVQAFTVAANGKISGKMLRNDGTWTLAADSFASYDAANGAYLATVIGKNGKLLETNEVTVAASGVSGLTASAPSLSWTAYQNLWKRADTKAAQPVFKSNIPYELGDPGDANNTLKLTFKKDGVVAFAGKVEGASVSGSSQLVRLSEDGTACRVTLYAPPKPTAKPPFKGFCKTFAVTLTLDEQKIVINAVLVDEILDDWLNGNPDGEGDEDFYGPSQGNGDCQSECD